MGRFLFFLLFPFTLAAQFTYTIDQSIPVESEGRKLKNPWAGGLNAAQVNTMELNADGHEDLVIYDNTTGKVNTFLNINNTYQYAPEYEILFPDEVSTFMVLRDYNCDGKKDLFTFGQIGVFVYKNITQPGKPISWKKLKFFNSETSLYSEVLLTKGFSMTNLLPGTSDMPNFIDMDGDGDLDVLNMKFVSPSQAEYHKNFSMELYGTCDSLALVRQTQKWGDFLECSCGKIAFGSQTCADIGGRVQHTGGKALLTIDMDNDGDQDLLYSEESCAQVYYMQNLGDASVATMNGFAIFPATNPVLMLYPATYREDLDFDGKADLIASTNLYARNSLGDNFQKSLWLYRNTGTNQLPAFTFVKDNFLQEDMIEVGDFSAPAFTDYDQDGDLDLFIGRNTGASARGSIYYYQNTGTTSTPEFQFVTDDLLGISGLNYYNIKPQFIDIDKNGGTDLTFTATNLLTGNTRIYYVLSSSTTSPFFGGQQLQVVNGLPLNSTENVTMTDIDQDGKPDLLIGRFTGALEYWRNTGNGVTFTLANGSYLGLGSSPLRQSITAVPGDLDGDGHDDLVVGDQLGVISIFGDFRSSGANLQPETNVIYDSFSKTYTSKNLGGRLRPIVVNLLGTDKPEIVTGNTQGGLYVLKNDNGQALAEVPVIVLFPNPVPYNQTLSIRPDRNVRMDIFTILGQPIGSSQFIPANQTVTYPLQEMAPGIYVARFTYGSKATSQRFVIR